MKRLVRHRNGRITARSGGRFTSSLTLEEMGFKTNHEKRTCGNCGHVWFPVLLTGRCPECQTQLQLEKVGERGDECD